MYIAQFKSGLARNEEDTVHIICGPNRGQSFVVHPEEDPAAVLGELTDTNPRSWKVKGVW